MAKGLSDVLSVADAGKILAVKPRQVRHLITTKVLKAEMFGGSYIIRRSDLAKVPKVRKPGPKGKKSK